MALTINYLTRVISVPQNYLTALGGSLYELDANALRNDLKNLEDSEDGVAFPPTLRHSTESTLSGVTYARQLEIINGYTLSFENTGTPYTVTVVGANHNLGDVTVFDGGMSMIIGNSAGLISVNTGGTVAPSAQEIRDAMTLAPVAAPVAGSIDSKIANVADDVLAAAVLAPIHANMKETNDEALIGDGSEADKFRSHLVP